MFILLDEALRKRNPLIGIAANGVNVTITRSITTDEKNDSIEIKPYFISLGTGEERGRAYLQEIFASVTHLSRKVLASEEIISYPSIWPRAGRPIWTAQSNKEAELAINFAMEVEPEDYKGYWQKRSTWEYPWWVNTNSPDRFPEVRRYYDTNSEAKVISMMSTQYLYLDTDLGEVLVLTLLQYARALYPHSGDEEKSARHVVFNGVLIS